MQIQSDARTRCNATAIKLLAIREHSRVELKSKLIIKGWPKNIIEQVLTELESINLQSDLRFSQAVMKSRMARGYGPVFIRHYLREKGVESMVIETILDFNNPGWQKTLSSTTCKKFGEQKPVDFKHKTKQMNFLTRRGFTCEQIREYYAF